GIDPVRGEIVRDIAGRQASLDLNVVKVFDGIPRPVSYPALSDIATGIGHSFAPSVVNIEPQSAREPLPERRLPGVVIRLLRIVIVRALDIARIRTDSRDAVDHIERSDHHELHAACSYECALQHQ